MINVLKTLESIKDWVEWEFTEICVLIYEISLAEDWKTAIEIAIPNVSI